MKKILIIEDDQILLKMYKDKFSVEGFAVETAPSGETGVVKAIEGMPDFIVLDLMMEGMDGVSVLQVLKEMPKTSQIPVAVLTAISQDVAEKMNAEILKKAVAYWRKDEQNPSDIVEEVKKYLGAN